MDMNALMTQPGMREWTETERDENVNAATQLRQMAQIIKARLENMHIDGDRSAGQARKRARQVVRPLYRAARDLDRAAAHIEAMNAVYGREVLELPARRARELERKEMRRQRLGIAAGGAHEQIKTSLGQSASALAGATPVGNPQVNAVQQTVQYTNPHAFPFPGAGAQAGEIPHIGDLFELGKEAM